MSESLKSKFIPILLVLIVLAVAGWYVGVQTLKINKPIDSANDNSNLQNNTNLNLISIPQNKFISDNAWKTYANEIYGYEIKYHGDWFISEPHPATPAGVVKNYIDPIYISTSQTADSPNRRDLNVQEVPWARITLSIIQKKSPDQSLEDWLQIQDQNPGPGSDAAVQYVDISGKKFLGTNNFDTANPKNAYFELRNDKILMLSFVYEVTDSGFSEAFYTMIKDLIIK
ncbi:hypothetical protein EPN15_01435 [Patescibacteria group bacterium]|nr:MAG: hypothetical protein EPN15_01435 [Patescibacteria group bacterium]